MTARRTNHLLQLVPQRAARLQARLEAQRTRLIATLPVTYGTPSEAWLDHAAAQSEPQRPLAAGTHLGRGWQRCWCRVVVPAGTGNRELAWRCQGETTVWRAGEPWAGLDVGHPTCPVPDGEQVLWLAVGSWQTGMWVAGAQPLDAAGARFEACLLQERDPTVAAVLADLDILRKLAAELMAEAGLESPGAIGWCAGLDRVDPLLRLLLGALEQACDAFDGEGLAALAASLQAARGHLRAPPWTPRVALIAQSHIDLVYLWPERVGIDKGVHTCATQLRLLESDPEFRFTFSQPLHYLQIGAAAPALLASIRRRIAEGRWEVTGGFACEPDTNLPCGEALRRSLIRGQQITAELTGAPGTVCWLPDTFGYNACLPGLLRAAGITAFVTTKLAWSGITRFPWSSFVWRGHDGAEVVAHLIPVGYNTSSGDGVKALRTATRAYREVHVHDELLVGVGYGDGGGGPTPELAAFAHRSSDLAGLPRTRWSRVDAAMARLAARRDELPVHQGELYLEYHRGVLTTQQQYKQAYRGLEQALQAWEAARCAWGGGPLPQAPWDRLFLAQFHDALPGTSIADVYHEGTPQLRAEAAQCLAAALAELGGAGDLPFNTLPFARIACVAGQNWRLPALGTGEPCWAVPTIATCACLDNGLVRAEFAGGDLVRLGGLPLTGGCLTLAEDHPANYDAWEIERQSLRLARRVGPTTLAVAAPGRLRGTCALGERSRLTLDYVLLPGERHLRLEVTVDWREDHRLLRYELATGCAGTYARFGCPFGSVLRPQQPSSPQVEAQWEVPGSRWAAALRDDGTGVALLAASQWGFSCRDGHLGVSLLRASTYPDAQADRGVHQFELALGAFEPAFADDRLPTAAAAEALFTPPLLVARSWQTAGLPPAAGSVVPSWAEPTATGFSIRRHEVSGSGAEPYGVDSVLVPRSPAESRPMS